VKVIKTAINPNNIEGKSPDMGVGDKLTFRFSFNEFKKIYLIV